MAENNKLYITISDKRGEGGNGGGVPTPNNQLENNQNEGIGLASRYIEHEMFHFVKGQATKAVNFALSNVGNFTGNYMAQTKVNEIKQSITSAMSIATTTLAGLKMGGGYGAAFGFLLGVESLLVGATYDVIGNEIENARTNYNVAQLRNRVGLNTTEDGSRGTEN